MTDEFDAKQLRPGLTPTQVFWRFFLLGPVFSAAVQLLLLNALLLFIFLSGAGGPSSTASFGWAAIWIFAGMEVSGAIEAILVFVFGLPASFLVGVCAMSSYMVLRRVNFVIVLAATLAAVLLENMVAPAAYAGYFATYSVRGPWIPEPPDPDFRAAAVLGLLLHIVSVAICWWLVRKERLSPLVA
jgi:hypothetical protein